MDGEARETDRLTFEHSLARRENGRRRAIRHDAVDTRLHGGDVRSCASAREHVGRALAGRHGGEDTVAAGLACRGEIAWGDARLALAERDECIRYGRGRRDCRQKWLDVQMGRRIGTRLTRRSDEGKGNECKVCKGDHFGTCVSMGVEDEHLQDPGTRRREKEGK